MTVTVDDVIDYAPQGTLAAWYDADSDSYPQVADALAAETVVQLGRVTYRPATDDVPVPDNSDLEEALKRRVLRNLAMRPLPLSIQNANSEFGPVRIGSGQDPEIRRLEATRRRMPVG